jgi:carbonic anhydrase
MKYILFTIALAFSQSALSSTSAPEATHKTPHSSLEQESLQKIVKMAEPATSEITADGPINLRPVISTEPAPGLAPMTPAFEPSTQAQQPTSETGHDEEADKPREPAAATTAPAVKGKPAAKTEKVEKAKESKEIKTVSPAVKEKESEAAQSHTAAPTLPTTASALTGVPAETSMKWLTNGNTRYLKRSFRSDGKAQTDRDRTAPKQKPHAIVLTCSDSRVPPELIFDQGLGEIFTIRVAGEAIDSSVLASIEYAIENINPSPHLLIVMGHTKCGAVDAALNIKDGDSAGSEALDKLLTDIRPRLKTVMSEKRSSNLEVESTLNADGVARDLVKRSEIIRKKVESGELVIKPALYWVDTGRVRFF